MSRCQVKGCPNKPVKNRDGPRIYFYQLGAIRRKNPDRFGEFLAALNHQAPFTKADNLAICSVHFADDAFEPGDLSRVAHSTAQNILPPRAPRLKADAWPTLHMSTAQPKQKKKAKRVPSKCIALHRDSASTHSDWLDEPPTTSSAAATMNQEEEDTLDQEHQDYLDTENSSMASNPPNSNNQTYDFHAQGLNTVEDMEQFYSRCLLCTCRPDVTPHLHIFSEAGNQLQLADKINKYLNIQLEAELPQNVCHSCMEKLEVTHELVTSSQQARIMLLQMKQQIKKYGKKVKHEENCSMTELDSYQPATDSAAIDNEIKEDEIPMDHLNCQELDQSANDFAVQVDERPTLIPASTSEPDPQTTLDTSSAGDSGKPPTSRTKNQIYGGPVKCDICNVWMKHKYLLVQHKNQKHNMNLSFDCGHCDQKYLAFHTVSSHIRIMHTVKDHVCEVCGESFTKKMYASHIKRHQKNLIVNVEPPKLLLNLESVLCTLCSFRATNKFILINHMNSEHRDVLEKPLPFCCDLCDNKEFANYKRLMQHRSKVHLPKMQCVHCDKMITRYKMANHLKLHQSEQDNSTAMEAPQEETEPFEEVLITEIDIEEHAIKREPEEYEVDSSPQDADEEPPLESSLAECHTSNHKLLECEVCCFYTYNEAVLANHMQVHQTPNTADVSRSVPAASENSRLKTQKCGECGLNYVHSEILAWHKENCHGTNAIVKVVKISNRQYKFQCIFCDTVFQYQQLIIEHLRSQHQISNLPFRCNNCDRSFTCTQSLKSHQNKCKIPTKQELKNIETSGIKCKLCEKSFKSEKQMKKHVSNFHAKSLRKENYFKCGFCEESFTSFSRLKSHYQRKHPGKSIFQCEICDSEFNSQYAYTRHQKYKHAFTCDICSATFSSHLYIKKHIKTMHLLKKPLV